MTDIDEQMAASAELDQYVEREFVPFIEADKAVHLIETKAKEYGVLVGRCKGLENKRKVIRAYGLLNSKKPTVAERQAESETTDEYKKIIDDIENAWAEKTTLETYLKAAEMTFELYRSSNRRQQILWNAMLLILLFQIS